MPSNELVILFGYYRKLLWERKGNASQTKIWIYSLSKVQHGGWRYHSVLVNSAWGLTCSKSKFVSFTKKKNLREKKVFQEAVCKLGRFSFWIQWTCGKHIFVTVARYLRLPASRMEVMWSKHCLHFQFKLCWCCYGRQQGITQVLQSLSPIGEPHHEFLSFVLPDIWTGHEEMYVLAIATLHLCLSTICIRYRSIHIK